MARRIAESELRLIEEAVEARLEGMTAQQIADTLQTPPPRRTLQYRLKFLVDNNRLVRKSEGRWARYLPAAEKITVPSAAIYKLSGDDGHLPLSKAGNAIRAYVGQPIGARKPAGYDRAFRDTYKPNETYYLTAAERDLLCKAGTPAIAEQPAGTYARQVLDRLLIDLSWNSSRLEGNTYSLLDTRRLIGFGEEAEGKDRIEAQMILNHKDAIEFLVSASADIGFNRYTILNLHALLANNLLADPQAAGRLRHISVGIERSVFHPLDVPQQIEEYFGQILATASAITDPFEQAFFVMVQIPYLQPFDDVNKRVSRLAANIPLIKMNRAPLSFTDVSRDLYTEAMLGVYETNRTELLRDVFIWAYERSAERYAAVRQSLGEPDPFRLKHRGALREIIHMAVRKGLSRKKAAAHIKEWTRQHIAPEDCAQFQETAEEELLSLHEGNFVRYHITPDEFKAWQEAWRR